MQSVEQLTTDKIDVESLDVQDKIDGVGVDDLVTVGPEEQMIVGDVRYKELLVTGEVEVIGTVNDVDLSQHALYPGHPINAADSKYTTSLVVPEPQGDGN